MSFVGILGICALAAGADELAALRWDVELSRPAVTPLDLIRGETVTLEPRLLSYAEPINLSNCTAVVLRYRPAGMTNGYYVATGSVDVAGSRLCVTWSPACELPATNYEFTLAASMPTGSTMRVFGKIKLQGSVGVGEPWPTPRSFTSVDWEAALAYCVAGWQQGSNLLSQLVLETNKARQAEYALGARVDGLTNSVARGVEAFAWGPHSAAGYTPTQDVLNLIGTSLTNLEINGIGANISGRTARVSIAPDSRIAGILARCTFLEQNALLTWVEMQIADSLGRVPLADGYRDFFEDLSGVNLGRSSNHLWGGFAPGQLSWHPAAWVQDCALTSGLVSQVNFNAADVAGHTVIAAVGANLSVHDTGGDYWDLDAASMSHGGIVGEALRFQSPYYYVNGELTGLVGSLSVNAWVRITDQPNFGETRSYSIFSIFGGADQIELLVYRTNPTAHGGTSQFGFAVLVGGQMPYDDDWHMLTIAQTGTVSTVYIDGTLQIAHTNASPYYTPGASYSLCIGGYPYGSPMIGDIDCVRIYDRAITPAEVVALYRGGYGTEDAGSTNLIQVGGHATVVATAGPATVLDFEPTEGRVGVWIEETESLAMNTDATA
ncbi:MAG: LamG domain-containing protein, partial [Kiritimatiellia bacterium]